MATPTAFSRTAASGAHIRSARFGTGAPAWASLLVADQFVTLPAPLTLKSWMMANMPAGAYGGTNPYGAILDAYCDPAITAGKQRWPACGGHGDGTANPVVEFDEAALTFSMLCLPTPPSKYPPMYASPPVGQTRNLTYPDGEIGHGGVYDLNANPTTYSAGHFRSDLTLANDIQYNTPRARASSHMYAAAVTRISAAKPMGVIHIFYQSYGEYDIASGTWGNFGDYPNNFQIGTQLDSGGFNGRTPGTYGTGEFQQGTAAHWDSVTDRFFVTLCDGGYRTSVMVLRPKTGTDTLPVTITNVLDSSETNSYGFIFPSTIPLPVGRNLYFFTKLSSPSGVMNQGFILNMDTLARSAFTIIGDTAGSYYTDNASQETIPAYYDGIAIRRWNYAPSQKGFIYSVNTTPESGSGTPADPYRLRQTARAIGGAIPADGSTLYVYKRLSWNAAAGAMILLPKSDGMPIALKLS